MSDFNRDSFVLPESKGACYVLCYFLGNSPEQQRVHLALSEDGYCFRAMNNNEPVVLQTLGKKCCRDPFIIKGKDGYFYIIATDMNAEEGWESNHALVSWRSKDLVSWTDEALIDIRSLGGEFALTNRAWAPQAIWDEEKQMYMLYWAHSTRDNNIAGHYYAYTKDFRSLESEPAPLYCREGIQCIDADIVYNKKKDCYYLYFKYEEGQKIAYVKSKHLTGPYDTEPVVCSLSDKGVEGSFMYNIAGTDSYVMLMDEYGTDHYFAQITEDFESFRAIPEELYSMDHLCVRHASVAVITREEYERAVKG